MNHIGKMMRFAPTVLSFGFLLSTCFTHNAMAGERLVYDVTQANTHEKITLYIQGEQARILSSADQTSALVYHAAERQIHILDHTEKSVTTIDQSSLEQLASVAKGLGEMAQSQGSVLGDIFKTFGLDNAIGEPARIEVKTENGSKSYSGQSCQMKQVYKNGELNTRICLTRGLRIASAERATLDSLINFAQLLVREGQMVLSQFSLPIPLLPDEAFDGTPVFIDDIASQTNATLTGFQQMDVLARQFTLPEGYSRTVLSL